MIWWFVSVDYLSREYSDMKETVKNLKTSTVHEIFQSFYKTMLYYCLNCRKNTENSNPKDAKTNKGKLTVFTKVCGVW